MSKKYHQIMEQIEVTDAMRHRILSHIEAESQKSKAHIFKKVLPIAACLALIVGLTLSIPLFQHNAAKKPAAIQTENRIVPVSSLEELTHAVGFSVVQIEDFPCKVDKVSYLSYWNQIAEIRYEGENQSLFFRQSADKSDNSGDFTDYEVVQTENIDGITITYKGHASDALALILWRKDGFSFSVRLSHGISREECKKIYLSIV